MRIAFVLAGLGAGGAERVVSLIASHWVARGWEVTVIAFDSPDDPIYHRFDPRVGFRRLGLPPAMRGKLSGLAVNIRRVRALRRALGELRPDLTIAFLTKINALTLIASTGLNIPVIVSERNNPRRQIVHRLWTWMLERLYRRADAIVVQTRASVDSLPAPIRKRATVIPNPIASVTATGKAGKSLTLSAVGRLVPQKGFDLLLDAFSVVAPDRPGWALTIWGEGPERAALEQQVERLGLQRRVRLPGNSIAPAAWTGSAAIFVLSSRFEGFPNALGEAMLAGLAVAAVDCEFGPREMIRDGIDGLLIPEGDVEALAAGLKRLMADATLRKRLGSEASISAAQFDLAGVARQWDGLIISTLGGPVALGASAENRSLPSKNDPAPLE